MGDTNLTEEGGNLYKFYIAHCINEIIYRFTTNIHKKNSIASMRETLIHKSSTPRTSDF